MKMRGMPKNKNKKTPSFAINSRPPTIISHLVASMVNASGFKFDSRTKPHGGCGDDPQWPTTILCVNWEIVAWSGVNAMKGCESMDYEWLRLCRNGMHQWQRKEPVFQSLRRPALSKQPITTGVILIISTRVMMWWKSDYCQHNKQTNHVSKYNIYIYIHTSR